MSAIFNQLAKKVSALVKMKQVKLQHSAKTPNTAQKAKLKVGNKC